MGLAKLLLDLFHIHVHCEMQVDICMSTCVVESRSIVKVLVNSATKIAHHNCVHINNVDEQI